MRVMLASVLLLAGCDRAFQLSRGDAPQDTTIDGPSTCLGGDYAPGRGGLLGACVDNMAPDQISLPAAIDTGDGGDCTFVLPQTDRPPTEVCVIAAQRIDVTRAIKASGPRPLVLVAIGDLTITTAGSIDVKSRGTAVGAGANFASCTTSDGASGPGGGGGAGGSFFARGGAGGGGGGAAGAGPRGGTAAPAINLDVVRGGCPGGLGGGSATGTDDGGVGGNSGGAVYLIAGGTISVAGTLEASGAPGGGGAGHITNLGGGGSGGGSGGLIGLDARTVLLMPTAKLSANSGGGGGGGGAGAGVSGSDTSAFGGSYPWISPGGSGSIPGGSGGSGGAAGSVGGGPGIMADGGGGGGGGGVGFIRIYGDRPVTCTNCMSPAPSP